ncbi:MFS transporter [Microbacterium sp. APC 3898]|uniref:MFS transporter n=1 Tax=Planococcus notacanthi TaxID=3035188 RepID=A0ABT7ZJD7_9BACL|nr:MULTISPECIES: MFS transporter [Terrabacteria group]MDN3427259.1 MFS transporter [Planococcus sp. APC 4016]MDN3499540.1 MFS transporter [Microbacterium sp. APC 3898]
MKNWRAPVIMLMVIGIANIGAWIYLIAMNLLVLKMTGGSALAVAGLYLMHPAAALLTNLWGGTLIDRMNKRRILVALDVFRAVLIGALPFFTSLPAIYLMVFLIGMGSSIFQPASTTYITMLLNPSQRKRFNSFRSLMDSGAFLIGPAVAGLLFLIGTPSFALYINAAALLISALLTLLLPNLEKGHPASELFAFRLLLVDWQIVKEFSHQNLNVMAVYFVFSSFLVMTAALDSLEAAFSITVLGLSEQQYGLLVSLAGLGIIAGSIVVWIGADQFSAAFLMASGAVLTAVGYLIYAVSTGFEGAASGFLVLAFFLAFANTGFQTYIQDNIPVAVMGRVISVYGLLEAVFLIVLTVLAGVAAELFSIRLVIICGSMGMLCISALVVYALVDKGRAKLDYPTEINR